MDKRKKLRRRQRCRPIMTYDIAMAAAVDAANKYMRSGGRERWNRDDYTVASMEFIRLTSGMTKGKDNDK